MTDVIAAPPDAPAPSAPGRSAPVIFADTPRDFRWLVWHGAWLELVTAGFYRFWLATDMRRHLWSHTSLEGDALEYTGVAKELLIGFLIALAILVPIYLAYFLLGVEAERLQVFASFPLFVFIYAFFQFALYRARRYRTSRTVWRGVRFWMTGSGWLYALKSMLWGLLMIVTFGIAYPWREAALERYKMRHTHYGDIQGRFEGTGWSLFKRIWWMALLALLIVTLPFIFPAFRAATWRWWISGARIGGVRFESKLSTGALMGKYWAVFGWVILIVVIDFLFVGAFSMTAALIIGGGGFDDRKVKEFLDGHVYVVYAAFILNYLIIALAMGVFLRIYLVRGVWERLASSTIVHGLEAADNVVAKGGLANALGEGFANDLDIGGF